MSNDTLIPLLIGLVVVVIVAAGFFLWHDEKKKRLQKRIARALSRPSGNQVFKASDALSLRRKEKEALPFIGKILKGFAPMANLQRRMERAGLHLTADRFALAAMAIGAFLGVMVALPTQSAALGLMVALIIGVVLPHFIINYLGKRRIKQFLILFPDAIDFMVRGLRSGLPVTESMNMIGQEMEEPVRSVFASVGEQVRLGVTLEKALMETAKKLNTTEFNFFITSLILQRETGGNLSEILNNLSEVLRKRFMMRMKIKAMSSEARASAYIVGSLPFVVLLALSVISPEYLDPLIHDMRGHIAVAGGALSMTMGIGMMMKMAKFEI